MRDILTIVPRACMPSGDTVVIDDVEYREFVIRPFWCEPHADSLSHDAISVDKWPRMLIPSGCFHPSSDKSVVDRFLNNKSVDKKERAAFWSCMNEHGGFETVSLDMVDKIRVNDPIGLMGSYGCDFSEDGTSCYITSRQAMAHLTAAAESLVLSKPDVSKAVAEGYESCMRDFSDEMPADRLVRDVVLGKSPTDFMDMHRRRRMDCVDYSDLPVESGLDCKLSHTVLRRDLISPDVQDVNGVPCRCVSVPADLNFEAGVLNMRSLYRQIYVPADCFRSMPSKFGEPVKTSSDDNAADGKPVKKPSSRFSRSLRDDYVICSIPEDVPIFFVSVLDGSYMEGNKADFSAKLTCLTSCQLHYNNLMCDLDRYHSLRDVVLDSPSGGAWITRAEMREGAPFVDFEQNGYVDDVGRVLPPTSPSKERVMESYRNSEAFSRGAPYGSDEPWDLSDKSGLFSILDGALTKISRSQVRLQEFPSLMSAPEQIEDENPDAALEPGAVQTSADAASEFASVSIRETPLEEGEQVVTETPEAESEEPPVKEKPPVDGPPVGEPPPDGFSEDVCEEFANADVPAPVRDMSDVDAAAAEILSIEDGFSQEFDEI